MQKQQWHIPYSMLHVKCVPTKSSVGFLRAVYQTMSCLEIESWQMQLVKISHTRVSPYTNMMGVLIIKGIKDTQGWHRSRSEWHISKARNTKGCQQTPEATKIKKGYFSIGFRREANGNPLQDVWWIILWTEEPGRLQSMGL